jgi:hypothetical protein
MPERAPRWPCNRSSTSAVRPRRGLLIRSQSRSEAHAPSTRSN